MSEEEKKIVTENDEINLVELAKTIWNGRKTIFKVILICFVIGLAVAFITPKEFTASSTMVPQTSQNSAKLGGLSSLASMAGFNIDLDQGGAEISPFIYPLIIESIPFHLEIMNTKYQFNGFEQSLSLYEYFTDYQKPGIISSLKKYTIGLPGLIKKSLVKSSAKPQKGTLPKLSEEQNKISELLSENIKLNIADKDGYMTLTAVFYDAELAAQVANKAQQLLQQYITEFKIEKASAQLDFIENRYKEKKLEFEKTQATLAAFRDRNKNVTSAIAQTEESRLQNEYQLAFEVYSELAKQMEQAQIKVKEDTPVFSIIKPITVPLEKSKPKRSLILVIWIFLGGILGIGLVLGKHLISDFRKKWNE